ncbi:general transcription factor 3C polypeptide 3-like [Liolophura sinensis]|uniref:general transcription factor 3C polypeptide 3-like n=1 Tax=Liolophura sinensis TaxID=3198878 RepID=UPI003158F337
MMNTNLFKGMTGESLSKEQYAEWKKLRRQAGDLLESSGDEEELSFSALDTSQDDMEVDSRASVSVSNLEDVSLGNMKQLSLMDVDTITTKYFTGEIEFSVFSEMMEQFGQAREQLLSGEQGEVSLNDNNQDVLTEEEEQGDEEGDKSDTPSVEDEEEEDDDDEEDDEDIPVNDDDEEWTPNKASKSPKKAKKKKNIVKVKILSPRQKKAMLTSPLSSMKKQKYKKKKRKGGDLPKHLQGLMGEAHLKFARGEHEEAVKMCMEVIRLAPMAAEPFQTLGLLYEELGDMQKSMQFSLIAAHLRPQDSEEWGRLAEISVEMGELKQAVTCFTKALKYDPTNIAYATERCALLEQLKEPKKVLEGFHYILKILPKTEGDKYLQIARDMAKVYHESSEAEKAIQTLREAFKEHPNKITSEDVNLLLELLMSQKMYKVSLEILMKHCGVVFYLADDTKWLGTDETGALDTEKLTRCTVSEWLPIDLRVKLVVCLIHLELYELAKYVRSPLQEESAESSGDLYLDVAEAYMHLGRYKDARPILEMLVKTKNYSLAAVWLRYAECLSILGEVDRSEEAYAKVVELAPNHTEARVALSNLQQQMGRADEAIRTLTTEMVEQAPLTNEERWLLLHKCMMLYSHKKLDEFISNGKKLIISHMQELYNPECFKVVLSYHTPKHRIEALRMLAKNKPDLMKTKNPSTAGKGLSKDELWDIFVKVFDVLVEEGKLSELEELAVLGLSCPLFTSDETMARETEDMCVLAFMMNKNGQFAYRFVKEICLREFDNVNAWNLFCQVMLFSADLRHNRFCLRLSMRHPDHLQLGILNGHISMVSGSFKHSIGEYTSALRHDPNNALLNLCIGLTFVHMAAQKFADKRHALLTQGCSFLHKYMDLRGECQEAYYNLGRAMHQLDLKYAAVYYYKKALNTPPAIVDDEGIFDLRREAAYNLSQIYRASKSDDYARMLLQQYCVV